MKLSSDQNFLNPQRSIAGTFIRETMIEAQTISPTDIDLGFVTDDPAEAVAHIKSKIA